MMDLKTGLPTICKPILYSLTEGKDGRLYVGKKYTYVIVDYCPVCGDKVKENE
jgi:hypothetical protein